MFILLINFTVSNANTDNILFNSYPCTLLYMIIFSFQENILRNQDCTLSELFKHLLSNLFIQSRNINFKSYQYAEDFIQFPFISNVQENYQSFNFVKDSIIDLHDIIARLQSIDKSNELNNDSEEICTFSTTDQCFKCIYSSYCTQFIPSKSSSLLSTTMNHLWHVQVCKTLYVLKIFARLKRNLVLRPLSVLFCYYHYFSGINN